MKRASPSTVTVSHKTTSRVWSVRSRDVTHGRLTYSCAAGILSHVLRSFNQSTVVSNSNWAEIFETPHLPRAMGRQEHLGMTSRVSHVKYPNCLVVWVATWLRAEYGNRDRTWQTSTPPTEKIADTHVALFYRWSVLSVQRLSTVTWATAAAVWGIFSSSLRK